VNIVEKEGGFAGADRPAIDPFDATLAVGNLDRTDLRINRRALVPPCI